MLIFVFRRLLGPYLKYFVMIFCGKEILSFIVGGGIDVVLLLVVYDFFEVK